MELTAPPPDAAAPLRLDVARIDAMLTSPGLEAAWDECLAGWSGDAEDASELRAWIVEVRADFLSLLHDVDDPHDLEVGVITWLINLKSQWILMNMQMQYQTQRTGMPDLRLMFKGSLLTSFLETVEGFLTYRDVERAHGFLARPLQHQEEASTVTVAEAQLQDLMTTSVEMGAVRNSLFATIGALSQHVTKLERRKQGPVKEAVESVEAQYQQFNQLFRDVQEKLSALRLVPAKGLLERAERFADKVAGRLERRVGITVQGEDVRLDRRVAEGLLEPVTALIRFMVSQSLEAPAERKAGGKPKRGQLHLMIRGMSNRIEFVLEDDGRCPPEASGDGEVAALLGSVDGALMPYAEGLTLLDAHKMGAAINDLERLGASMTVRPRAEGGLCFQVAVPMPQIFTEFVIVRVGPNRFGLPSYAVKELVRVDPRAIRSGDRHPLVRIREEVLPLLDTHDVLWPDVEQPPRAAAAALLVVLIEVEEQRAALIVDGVERLTEAVVQPLAEDMGAHTCVAGATALEDGNVTLVLDVEALLAHA